MIAEVIRTSTIPKTLVYETINGIPVYYKGYQDVLNHNLPYESIMGYGELQSLIINILGDYLKPIFKKEYWILSGETGLHVRKNDNFATDLVFYSREDISLKTAKNKYINKIPKVVIEVDTKADPSILEQMNYYHAKTQDLLDFGVGLVLWIYTDVKKVMVARPNEPWITYNWTDEIDVLGHHCSIQGILDMEE